MELNWSPTRSLGIRFALASAALLVAASLFVGCAAPPPTPTSTPAVKALVPTAAQLAAPTKPPQPTATTALAPPEPTAAARAAATAAPAPTAPAKAPVPANIRETLTTGYSINSEHFDPHRIRSTATGTITRLIYEQLVTRDPKTMELQPLLALSWRSVDPKTWEFKLRQGVKFHNGEDFNAEAAKLSFERMTRAEINSSALSYLGGIYESVEIVDPYTIRLKTAIPDPLWVARMAVEPVNMIPARWGATTDDREMSGKAVGSGPYKLMEFVVGDRSVVERNDAYWGEKSPTKRMIWKTIPDVRTRVAALQRGEVDVVNNLSIELVSTVERDANLAVYKEMGSFNHKFIFNISQNGPKYLQDKRVRQALNHAVDRQALIKGLFNGEANEYYSVLVKQMADYTAQRPYEYNPDKAKQLLAEAGYPNGFETELWVPVARYPMGEQATQAVADYLSKVGVKAKVTTAEWAVYNSKGAAHQMENIFYYPHSNIMWEPDLIMGYFLPERKRWNYYIPPESTLQIIRQAAQEFDAKKRHDLIVEAQKLLWEDAPHLYLYQIPEIYGLNKKVKGFLAAPDQHTIYKNAYIEQ